MRMVLVYRAVTKYVMLKNTVEYKIKGRLEQSDYIEGK